MVLQRQATVRLLLMAGVATAFAMAWHHFSTIPLLVVGQPRAVGLLQRDREAPFFRALAAKTGLPLLIDYRTADSFGLKDAYQLEAVRDGRIDIVSLRFMQNIAKEPSLEGMDLPGMISDFGKARQVVAAYGQTVDRYLQRAYQAKMLGFWSFGPQVMLCRSSMTGLRDLKGRKVRVASPGLAQLVRAIGGIPAILPFEDTKEALAIGLVDCAVTSAASANFAGWTQHTNYYYPLAFQFGFNGYAMSLRKWKELSPQERDRLARAFQVFGAELWRYSEHLQQESERSILGGSCRLLRPHQLQRVPVSREDVRVLKQISREIVLPSWSARCEQRHPGCREDWNRTVAPVVEFDGSGSGRP